MTQGWVDRVIFTAAAGGVGDFVVSAAVTGYNTPAQSSAVDGVLYHYSAQITDSSGTITEWEVGTGAYTAATTTLARTTVELSSNSNALVNFSSAPQVMITALAQDFSFFTPGAPQYSIQFNNPLGSFDGDDQALWFPNSTPGDPGLLLLNSADALVTPPTSGAFTPGFISYGHAAFGNMALIDEEIFFPPDGTIYPSPAPITINDYQSSADWDINTFIYSIIAAQGITHSGSGTLGGVLGQEFDTQVNSDSTGDITLVQGYAANLHQRGSGDVAGMVGMAFSVHQYGSGTLNTMDGFGVDLRHHGSNTIDTVSGFNSILRVDNGGDVTGSVSLYKTSAALSAASVVANYTGFLFNAPTLTGGASITTNCFGVNIKNHAGLGGTKSYNLYSEGATSLNVFEGNAVIGDVADPSAVTFRSTVYSAGDVGRGEAIVAGDITGLGLFDSSYAGYGVAWFLQYDAGPIYGPQFQALGDNPYGSRLYFVKSRSTDGDTFAVVQDGDEIFSFFGTADNGVDVLTTSAGITCYVDGTVSSGAIEYAPARIDLMTSAGGTPPTGNLKTRLSIAPGGTVEVIKDLSVGEYIEMPEISAPSAPAANKSRLFTQDNGAGKTQLVVLFPTGAVQVIATEP